MNSNKYYSNSLITLFVLCISFVCNAETSIHGLVQGQIAVNSDSEKSYLYKGTGLLRYDDEHNASIAQALLKVNSDLTATTSVEAVLNHTNSPKSFTNVSQAFIKYTPVWSPDYRWQFKAGMFYPEMSLENPDIGWLSPYNYTNSAINSWIGEELRTIGAEVKLIRPGRAHNSPHSFALLGSVFKANDTTGTILSWRGWALHDKQTLFNEVVPFANYPTIAPGGIMEKQASWVDPYREIDGNWGFYVGAHWDYKNASRLRYYHYNNQADETILARGGQYAWQTIFHSLAWQYRFNQEWRFITQIMDGNTSMGIGKVNVDFTAWYAMVSYKSGQHRVSARIDDFKTIDKDMYWQDNNNGDGNALTLSYRYDWHDNIQLGLEYLYLDSFQANRMQWYWDPNVRQQQLLGVVQYRF